MAFTPQTEVHLLYVPLDNTYKNQIRFGSSTSQANYFLSKTIHQDIEFTFQRRDNKLRVAFNYDDVANVNYCMYKNEDKWYYAFITKMEYINEGMTELYIETDVYQTWLFETQLMESFVIREHVSSDNIGEHLVEEGLETGEYIYKSNVKDTSLDEIWFVVGYSDGLKDVTSPPESPTYGNTFGGVYGNVYSGLRYKAFSPTGATVGDINSFIESYSSVGKLDAIAMIFAIPKKFLPSGVANNSMVPYGGIGNYTTKPIATYRDTIDGYVPKNKKLYTYPYYFLYVSNNKGGAAVYRLEDFENGESVAFNIGGNLSPNPTAYCVPLNYKGVSENWENMLTMDGYPLCSWNNDIFANWVGQNTASFLMNTAGAALGILGGAATGSGLGVVGGVMGVLGQMGSLYQHSIQPDQAKGNIGGGSLNIALSRQSFYFSQMTIKAEFAQRIDKFFDMYGYKVNTVKVPNTNNRPCWNYVHTIDVNIKGSIPSDDMRRLKAMYNDGVTLWSSGDNVGNYSLNNH